MKWHIETRKVSELIPDENNPRVLTKKGLADLKKSVDKFGLAEPIVINTDNMIIGGHARTKVLNPDDTVEVYVPERKLEEHEYKELNVRLNKNIAGEWDWDILANRFEVDDLLEWGFDEKELKIELDVEEDEAPEVQEEAVSKLGEIYHLGRHRVMCGDSTKKEDVEKLMNGQKADMVFTDPPYSVNYAKKNREVLGSKDYTEIENDNLSVKETARTIWKPVFDNLAELSKDDCSIYCTMPQGGDQMMMMMMMDSWIVKHELIWVKEAPVFSMGRLDYDYKHEPIIYGWLKKHNWYGKGQFTKSVWEISRDGNKSHPTMKPIALIANALMNSTIENNLVVDLFLGSGSTLIACEQTNRTCYGMEIDPRYVDVIRKRYAKFIGKEEEWQTITPKI